MCASLAPQGQKRIDRSRPPGGQPRGNNRRDCQEADGARECQRVERADAVEHRTEHSCGWRADAETDEEADEHRLQDFSDDERHGASPLCAKRHPDADFVRAFSDGLSGGRADSRERDEEGQQADARRDPDDPPPLA